MKRAIIYLSNIHQFQDIRKSFMRTRACTDRQADVPNVYKYFSTKLESVKKDNCFESVVLFYNFLLFYVQKSSQD